MTRKQPQFNLEPITPQDYRSRSGGIRLTLDKYGRLVLSSEYRKQLGIYGKPAYIYVAVDPAQKTVAIVRQDVTKTVANAKAIRVQARGEAQGRAVNEKLALKAGERYHFEYLGKIDHDGTSWDGFRMVDDHNEE